jgi:xanthine dehydrogenase YagR molybdenum-binding subunit
VVAEEFGLRAEDIGAYIGDTRYPVGPPSGGSQVTSSLTPAARNAAHRAARDLADRLAPLFQASSDDIVFSDGKVLVRDKPDTAIPFKNAVREAKIGEISHRAKRPDDYEGHVASVAFGLQVSRHESPM